jgi:PAS domain S-box-containing protein
VLLRVQDGRVVSGTMSASLIRHEGEELIVGIVHDVTEAKRLERRAHQSERMFGALFESSPEPITLYRLSDGMRLAANSAWERVTGYPRERAQGRPATDMSLFRDPAQRAQLIARVEIEGRVSNAEACLVRADGSERA